MTANQLTKRIVILFSGLMLMGITAAFSQKVAVKTNILYDALLTPDLGIETKLAPKWTLELTGNINLWEVNERKWMQWSVQPEARYWFCKAFSEHFLGFHVIGGQYNFGNLPFDFKFLGTDFGQLQDNRLQGWMVGTGVAYGYSWILDRHWNLEAEIGIGWIYTRYDKYPCAVCGTKIEANKPHNYFGLTKTAINIEYVF